MKNNNYTPIGGADGEWAMPTIPMAVFSLFHTSRFWSRSYFQDFFYSGFSIWYYLLHYIVYFFAVESFYSLCTQYILYMEFPSALSYSDFLPFPSCCYLVFPIILLVIALRAPLLDAATEPCPPSLCSNLRISPHYQRQLLSPTVLHVLLFCCYFRSDFEKTKDER